MGGTLTSAATPSSAPYRRVYVFAAVCPREGPLPSGDNLPPAPSPQTTGVGVVFACDAREVSMCRITTSQRRLLLFERKQKNNN